MNHAGTEDRDGDIEDPGFDMELAEFTVVHVDVRYFSVLYRQNRRFYLDETGVWKSCPWGINICLGVPEGVSEARVVEWLWKIDRSPSDFIAIIAEIDREESLREWERNVEMFGKETLWDEEYEP